MVIKDSLLPKIALKIQLFFWGLFLTLLVLCTACSSDRPDNTEAPPDFDIELETVRSGYIPGTMWTQAYISATSAPNARLIPTLSQKLGSGIDNYGNLFYYDPSIKWKPKEATESSGSTAEASQNTSPAHPTDLPNLLSFWDFQEPAGSDRVAKGQYPYALKEMNGPISRVEDGIFGPYSTDFEWGHWFRIERKDAEGLDLHGEDQQVTMVAWVKRESDRVWQYIAGMWDEGLEKFKGEVSGEGPGAPARQYALFINGYWQTDHTTYERIRATNQIHGYVSPFGGASPGHPFAFDYATGATALEENKWYMIAYTFDGNFIKVYVNGKLDSNGNYNPFQYDGPIHDGRKDGADFTVALRRVPGFPAYPADKPENTAGFDGRIGGLAVYDRALTEEEIKALYQGTMTK